MRQRRQRQRLVQLSNHIEPIRTCTPIHTNKQTNKQNIAIIHTKK